MFNLAFISHFYAVVIRIIQKKKIASQKIFFASYKIRSDGTATSQTHSQSQAHSHCDITPVLRKQHPGATGWATYPK